MSSPFDALAETIAGKWYAALERLCIYDLVGWSRTLAGLTLGANVVLQSEIDRIHADSAGGPIDDQFEGEVPLGRTEGSVRAT